MVAYADLLSQATRHEDAVAMYRKSLAASPHPDVAAWEQVQIARNFRDGRKVNEARSALVALAVGDEPLFRRVAAVLERDLDASSNMKRKRP